MLLFARILSVDVISVPPGEYIVFSYTSKNRGRSIGLRPAKFELGTAIFIAEGLMFIPSLTFMNNCVVLESSFCIEFLASYHPCALSHASSDNRLCGW